MSWRARLVGISASSLNPPSTGHSALMTMAKAAAVADSAAITVFYQQRLLTWTQCLLGIPTPHYFLNRVHSGYLLRNDVVARSRHTSPIEKTRGSSTTAPPSNLSFTTASPYDSIRLLCAREGHEIYHSLHCIPKHWSHRATLDTSACLCSRSRDLNPFNGRHQRTVIRIMAVRSRLLQLRTLLMHSSSLPHIRSKHPGAIYSNQ